MDTPAPTPEEVWACASCGRIIKGVEQTVLHYHNDCTPPPKMHIMYESADPTPDAVEAVSL